MQPNAIGLFLCRFSGCHLDRSINGAHRLWKGQIRGAATAADLHRLGQPHLGHGPTPGDIHRNGVRRHRSLHLHLDLRRRPDQHPAKPAQHLSERGNLHRHSDGTGRRLGPSLKPGHDHRDPRPDPTSRLPRGHSVRPHGPRRLLRRRSPLGHPPGSRGRRPDQDRQAQPHHLRHPAGVHGAELERTQHRRRRRLPLGRRRPAGSRAQGQPQHPPGSEQLRYPRLRTLRHRLERRQPLAHRPLVPEDLPALHHRGRDQPVQHPQRPAHGP